MFTNFALYMKFAYCYCLFQISWHMPEFSEKTHANWNSHNLPKSEPKDIKSGRIDLDWLILAFWSRPSLVATCFGVHDICVLSFVGILLQWHDSWTLSNGHSWWKVKWSPVMSSKLLSGSLHSFPRRISHLYWCITQDCPANTATFWGDWCYSRWGKGATKKVTGTSRWRCQCKHASFWSSFAVADQPLSFYSQPFERLLTFILMNYETFLQWTVASMFQGQQFGELWRLEDSRWRRCCTTLWFWWLSK